MRLYLRNVDWEVRSEDLRPLPEAVQGRDHCAGEQLVQDRLHERDLCHQDGDAIKFVPEPVSFLSLLSAVCDGVTLAALGELPLSSLSLVA